MQLQVSFTSLDPRLNRHFQDTDCTVVDRTMDPQAVQELFDVNLKRADNVDRSPAVATVMTLINFLEAETSLTFQEFAIRIKKAMEALKNITSAEVESVSEIFLRYISLRTTQFRQFKDAKEDLMNRGKFFLKNVSESKRKVASIAHQFITDGSNVLVHSNSRVVFYTLSAAAKHGKTFNVYVTQSAPTNTGEKMCNWLKEEGINAKLILDAAIGYYMEKMDIVLVGAEAVVTNGGIINKVGTYPMAVCAREVNKPFYVLVESYKFSRLYPLKQEDIPECMKFKEDIPECMKSKKEISECMKSKKEISECMESKEEISSKILPHEEKWSVADYTDPKYVTLLITDLGPLATAAVSDVLMQLYL